ncbi:hypothetical protein KCU65_g7594, partial [Aureobasidium melanogenum]
MPYAAEGSVSGCGLAPGPALLLVSWVNWIIFFFQLIVFKRIKLPYNEGSDAGVEKGPLWKRILILLQVIVSFGGVIYGLYDIRYGYKIGVSGPNAIFGYVMFLRQFRISSDRLLRSCALYLPVVFCFIAWVVAYIESARGAGIIVDQKLASQCLSDAQEFLDTQDLGLKRSLPAVLAVSSLALVATDMAWRGGKLEGDIYFVKGGYIIFGIITLVLHLIDAFVGVGSPYGCGGCSVNSGAGYYNYHVNWYQTQDGTRRQGHGAWYKAQNAFQS